MNLPYRLLAAISGGLMIWAVYSEAASSWRYPALFASLPLFLVAIISSMREGTPQLSASSGRNRLEIRWSDGTSTSLETAALIGYRLRWDSDYHLDLLGHGGESFSLRLGLLPRKQRLQRLMKSMGIPPVARTPDVSIP